METERADESAQFYYGDGYSRNDADDSASAARVVPLPFGSDRPDSQPAFAIRGIKGWGWSTEQCLAEIPVMANYRLNFLMNDYSSLWELGSHGAWD